MANKEKRTFTVSNCSIGYKNGSYTGTVPSAVAKKVANKLYSMIRGKGKDKSFDNPDNHKYLLKDNILHFTILETTKDSKGKRFYYQAKHEKLDEPKVVKRGPVEIVVNHQVIVKAIKDNKELKETHLSLKRNTD